MTYTFTFENVIQNNLTAQDVRRIAYPRKSLQWVRANLEFITEYNESNQHKPLAFTTQGMAIAESYRAQKGRLLSKAASKRSPFAGSIQRSSTC